MPRLILIDKTDTEDGFIYIFVSFLFITVLYNCFLKVNNLAVHGMNELITLFCCLLVSSRGGGNVKRLNQGNKERQHKRSLDYCAKQHGKLLCSSVHQYARPSLMKVSSPGVYC